MTPLLLKPLLQTITVHVAPHIPEILKSFWHGIEHAGQIIDEWSLRSSIAIGTLAGLAVGAVVLFPGVWPVVTITSVVVVAILLATSGRVREES